MPRSRWAPLGALLLLAPAAAMAQQTARAAAGPEYRAGALHELLLGKGYRALWTTPVTVPVLDPDRYGGGLTVEEQGGGLSTESLRMKGKDGREYVFRSVDKNVTPSIPKDLRGTIPHDVVQDLVSAKNPASALVVPPLLDAAGVLHATASLYVMPDHPFLGRYRERFRGRLGLVEERPTDGFGGSKDVKGSDDFRKLIEEEPRNRVDARAFLTARLMDMYVGDWDRHWDQWRWARFDSAGVRWWKPIPRDRDNAFNDNHGLIPSLGRSATPILVRFGPRFDAVMRYHALPAELDRLLLSALPREVWDSTAQVLRARLTDAVIDAAVRRMPAEYMALRGEELAAALKSRRDQLPQVAAEFYRIVAREVDVHTTDAREDVDVQRLADGSVDVTVHAKDEGDAGPYFHRVFRPGETREVRLYLQGGDDHAAVRGAGDGILVRVIGGAGDDELADQAADHGRTVFYDDRGHNRIDPGSGAKVDTRPWQPPRTSSLLGNPPPPRDWGTASSLLAPYASWELNIGPVVGFGPNWKRFGFRRAPHAEQVGVRVLWAPLERNGFGGVLHYDRQITNRPASIWLNARGSNFEDVRFHGFGNGSPADPDRDFYEVDQTQVRVQAAYQVTPVTGLTLYAGPAARWTDPGVVHAATPDGLGTQTFWQAGGVGGAVLDLRDSAAYPRSGVRALVTAAGYGSDLGGGGFGRGEAEAAGYLSVPGSFGPTLALRAGGQKAVGHFPFQESAFVGGPMNLRGFAYQRFRGDASLYGSAELRAQLAYVNLGVARFHLGAFGLADAGRVYVDGASPGGWHTGVGGGLSFRTMGRTGTVAYARGERGIVYVTLGMPF